MKLFARRALMPEGWRENQVVTVERGKITSVAPGSTGDLACELLTPGLFDIHAHGGEGYYTRDVDPDGLTRWLHALARHGVTDVLFTVGSFADYSAQLSLAQALMARQATEGTTMARVQGLHLEGPFINPKKCGAMPPENALPPSAAAFDARFGHVLPLVFLVTVAPEMPGADALISYLISRHIKAQLGHTDASFDQAEAAFALGADSLCHAFNACRGIHHREPGVVTAALLDEKVSCEAICDLRHLHPAILKMIYRLKGPDRMMVVSDSGAVTGLPDGEYVFHGTVYRVVDGVNRVNGGETLAGGACYLDKSVARLISIGIPSADAFNMASQTPAKYLGLSSLGAIAPGMPAHLAGWTAPGQCAFSMIENSVITNI